MAVTPKSKLIECREMLFAASQNFYVIAGALKDREMPNMAETVFEFASMLADFSLSIDPLTDEQEAE